MRIEWTIYCAIHIMLASNTETSIFIVSLTRLWPIPFQDKDPRLEISEGGIHAAEGLVLARYFYVYPGIFP